MFKWLQSQCPSRIAPITISVVLFQSSVLSNWPFQSSNGEGASIWPTLTNYLIDKMHATQDACNVPSNYFFEWAEQMNVCVTYFNNWAIGPLRLQFSVVKTRPIYSLIAIINAFIQQTRQTSRFLTTYSLDTEFKCTFGSRGGKL